MSAKSIAVKTGVFALCLAGAFGAVALQEMSYPVSDGVDYLEKHGYTNVEGGKIAMLGGCSKGEMGRRYKATNDEGEVKSKVVCSGIFGYHMPLFQQ